jgi:hypothetical protein
MDLKEFCYNESYWFHVTEDGDRLKAFANTMMNLRVLEMVEIS